MTPFEEMKEEQVSFDQVAMDERYLKKDVINSKNMKSIQFAKPYFQFSAACAGCAETTYIKLVSQLVGERMYIGNAAGCSSAYSGGAPILPYCRITAALVLPGSIPCLRTMPSSPSASSTLRMPSARSCSSAWRA